MSISPQKQSPESPAEAALAVRMDLTTALFDNMRFSRRSDMELAVLSFYQQIPGGGTDRIEIFRGATSIEHMKRIVNLLCRQLDYFPTPEQAAKKAPAKKKPGKA